MTLGVVKSAARDGKRFLTDFTREKVCSCLSAYSFELLNGCWSIDVGRDGENLLASIFDEPFGKLACACRFAGALKTSQKNDSRRLHGKIDFAFLRWEVATDDLRELAFDHAHQGLSRVEIGDDFFAKRFLLDA